VDLFIIALNLELWFDEFLFLKDPPKIKNTGLCWEVSLIIHDQNGYIAFMCKMIQREVSEIKDKSWLIENIES